MASKNASVPAGTKLEKKLEGMTDTGKRIHAILEAHINGDDIDLEPPAPYYWDEDTEIEEPTQKQILGHNLHWLGMKIFWGADFAGNILADLLGLNNSKYQWVIELKEKEEREKREREAYEAALEQDERDEQDEEDFEEADMLEGGAEEGADEVHT